MGTAENPDPGNKPTVAWAGWLGVAEAARRMNLKERAVRNLCEGTWQAGGVAKMEQRPDGGKGRWFISPDAHPSLKPNACPEFIACDTSRLTDAQRAELDERHTIYKAWRTACTAAIHARRQISQKAATAGFLTRLGVERGEAWKSITHRTLANWQRRYEKLGVSGLIDARWTKPAADAIDDRMLQEAAKFYLDASGKSKTECITAAEQRAVEMGWKVWRETAVRKYLNRLPVGEVTYRREGPEAFKQKCGPFIQRTYRDLKSNEIWQSDHHRMDVICRVGEKIDTRTGEVLPQYGRPWLTSFIDVRSRKILAFKVRAADPDSGVILAVFGSACRAHGVPETVYLDNGKDYDAGDFTGESKAQRRERLAAGIEDEPKAGIYAMLGVGHVHAGKYNARAKLIERLHRTIKEGFCHDFDTFTGGNPQEKPERLAEMVVKGVAPTVEEFAAAFGEWVEFYNNKDHQGESMDCTPNEAWNQNMEAVRTASPEMLDVLLQRRAGPVKVGRNGVVYKGIYFGQYDTGYLQGQRVYLRINDADLSKVSVWDSEERFLCWARANQVLPAHATHELLSEAIKQQRHHSKVLRNAQTARMAMHEDIPATMFRLQQARVERMARSRPENAPPTPSIIPVRSPIEGELEGYRTALERFQPMAAPAAGGSLFDAFPGGEESTDEERAARRNAFLEGLEAKAKIPSLLEICGVAS